MHERSWHLLPCYSIQYGKCTCGRRCNSPGKHPMTRTGLYEATNDRGIIEGWIRRWPMCQMAVRTGPESGLWVFDIDTEDQIDGRDFETLTAKTPRGRHHYFKWPKKECIRNMTLTIDHIKVDTRGINAYAIIPWPSNRYQWLNNFEILDAPDWILNRVIL